MSGAAQTGQFSDLISFGGFRRIGGGEQVVLAGRAAYLEGLHVILLYGAITAFISAALCAVLIRPSGFVQRGEPAQQPGAGQQAGGEPSLDPA